MKEQDTSEACVVGEPTSSDPNNPMARFVGSDSLTNILKNATPGQSRADVVKRVLKAKLKK